MTTILQEQPPQMPQLPQLPQPANQSPTPEQPVSGVLIVDKPAGYTSFDVVAKIKRLLHMRKVGHTGTLDPFATGVLVICLGEATKLVPWLQADTKEYTGQIRLGVTTDTLDCTGTITDSIAEPIIPAREQLEEAAASLTGSIQQMPPIFSAIKFKGQRLYKAARAGKPMPEGVQARDVTIHELTIGEVVDSDVDFRVVCSAGTYVRSLARDFGERVGLPAHLTALRRESNGEFSAEQAFPGNLLFQIGKLTTDSTSHTHGAGDWADEVAPLLRTHTITMARAAAMSLPTATVSHEDEQRLRVGKSIYSAGVIKWEGHETMEQASAAPTDAPAASPTDAPTDAPAVGPLPQSPPSMGNHQVAMLSMDDQLIAIAIPVEGNLLKPLRGFNSI